MQAQNISHTSVPLPGDQKSGSFFFSASGWSMDSSMTAPLSVDPVTFSRGAATDLSHGRRPWVSNSQPAVSRAVAAKYSFAAPRLKTLKVRRGQSGVFVKMR